MRQPDWIQELTRKKVIIIPRWNSFVVCVWSWAELSHSGWSIMRQLGSLMCTPLHSNSRTALVPSAWNTKLKLLFGHNPAAHEGKCWCSVRSSTSHLTFLKSLLSSHPPTASPWSSSSKDYSEATKTQSVWEFTCLEQLVGCYHWPLL